MREMTSEENKAYQKFLNARARVLIDERKYDEARIVLWQTQGVQELIAEWNNPRRIEEIEE